MKTINFQVSKTKRVEPDYFLYGIVIESDDVDTALQFIKNVESEKTKKVNLPTSNYIIPDNLDELGAIQVFRIKGRKTLEDFVNQLSEIQAIRGGIIKSEVEEEEETEFELITELTHIAN